MRTQRKKPLPQISQMNADKKPGKKYFFFVFYQRSSA